MIWMYLKQDYIGSYSRNIYALKGDKVAILNNNIDMCLVINQEGHLFHVKFENLSYQEIKKEIKKETIKKKKNEKTTKSKKRI